MKIKGCKIDSCGKQCLWLPSWKKDYDWKFFKAFILVFNLMIIFQAEKYSW